MRTTPSARWINPESQYAVRRCPKPAEESSAARTRDYRNRGAKALRLCEQTPTANYGLTVPP